MNDKYVRKIDKLYIQGYDWIAMDNKKGSFGNLFKRFRFKSGLATLAEFGNALAAEGLVYEDSLFSHWQKGDRVPKDRHLLLTILKVFLKKGGICTVSDANLFLTTADQRDLNEGEIDSLFQKLVNKPIFTAPPQLPYFVGREKYLKEICWQLLNRQTVLVHGEAGVGKTALAIKIAHTLKDKMTNGTLWYRCDIKKIDDILSDIGRLLGQDISRIRDKKIKSHIVNDLLASKNILLILDNVELLYDLDLFIHKNTRFALLITSKNVNFNIKEINHMRLSGLSEKEIVALAKTILGIPFVLMNLNKLKLLGKRVQNSPLAITVLMKRLEVSPYKLNSFILHLEKEAPFLYQAQYDNKTLYQSLMLSFKTMSLTHKKVLLSLGLFQGADFSQDTAAFINDLNLSEAEKKLKELNQLSFVETSVNKRYRLHPLIQMFIRNRIQNREQYSKLAIYYISLLSKYRQADKNIYYKNIEIELDNIFGVFKACHRSAFYSQIIELWKHIGSYLWDTGRWIDMRIYGKFIEKACLAIHDDATLSRCYICELSWLYFWQGNIIKAEALVKKGLAIAEKNKDCYLIAFANIRMGKIYQSKKLFKKAIITLMFSLKYFKKVKNLEKQGDILTYIGETFFTMGNNNLAKKYLLSALIIVDQINDWGQKAIIYTRLGGVYFKMGLYDKAFSYFTDSLLLEKRAGRRAGGTVWNNIGFGLVKDAQGDNLVAQKFFNKAKKEIIYLGFDKNLEKTGIFVQAMKKHLIRSGFYV